MCFIIKSKQILSNISEKLSDISNLGKIKTDFSESPEEIIEFIRKYIKDVYNVVGDDQDIRFVLNNLISSSSNKNIIDKLKKTRFLLK